MASDPTYPDTPHRAPVPGADAPTGHAGLALLALCLLLIAGLGVIVWAQGSRASLLAAADAPGALHADSPAAPVGDAAKGPGN